MSEIGYKYKVCEDELNELVEKADFDNSIAILEKRFCMKDDKPGCFNFLCNLKGMVSDWDTGRVFDKNSEIRWERNGDSFHVIWMIHNGNIIDDWDKEPLVFKEKRKVLLWGERIVNENDFDNENENEWYEKQIPQILKYPVKGDGKRVYLEIMQYTMPDGSPVYRFEELTTK